MGISFYSVDVKKPNISTRNIRKLLNLIIEDFSKKTGSIVYIFCNDEKIISINREFLNHDYFTDVITFDYSSETRVGGEIYISLDTVSSNSVLFIQNYELELLRVIIHGMLHIVGLKDKEPDEIANMRKVENYYMDLFKNA